MGSCCSRHNDTENKFAKKRQEALEEVTKDGLYLKHVSKKFKNYQEVVLAACFQNGLALEYASKKLRNDQEVVLAACSQNGLALEYASKKLRNDKETVLKACSHHGFLGSEYVHALKYASYELKNNREVVLKVCSQKGLALQYASEELQHDEEIVLAALSSGFHFMSASSKQLKSNRVVVLAACSKDGDSLQYASEELKNDKQIVLAACSENFMALRYASEALKNDKEVVMAACSGKTNKYGFHNSALQHASNELKNDKEFILAVCSQNGHSLQYAPESLRADKEVVMAAVESQAECLQFSLGGLNQDKDCLIKAGLWDKDYTKENNGGNSCLTKHKRKIVLSTKFSLAAESSPHATRFALELKKHPYIKSGGFLVYSPNAFDKGTCDPSWTDQKWPCRGTYDSCQKTHHLKTGVPKETESCWRYSFRYQLEEARRSGGCMIQVVDYNRHKSGHIMGDGQKIETEMAQDIGIKIFQYFEDQSRKFLGDSQFVNRLVSEIAAWYNLGCVDKKLCEIGLNLKPVR